MVVGVSSSPSGRPDIRFAVAQSLDRNPANCAHLAGTIGLRNNGASVTVANHPMQQLFQAGQSVWLDNIRRDIMDSGELAAMIANGLRGMTSNPSIFKNAIAGSTLYDAHLVELDAATPDASAIALFEAVAIADIQSAADEFRSLYDSSDGGDGFISLEVSPTLAHDTQGTIAEALRLWEAVDRPNLMVKVPATPAGIPAIEELIAQGVNINVTLIFSLEHYEAVAQAFISGLERCMVDPSRVASVASVFISRVDASVDALLEGVGSTDALAIAGQVALSAAKTIYQRYLELFGDDFEAIWGRGVHPQRVLWASTSTKNPAFRDVLYIEELVGDDTVNTVPPKTLAAFEDHGVVRVNAVTEDVRGAHDVLTILATVGVDLAAVCQDLQDAGVSSFAAAFEELLAAVEQKREGLRDTSTAVEDRLAAWQSDDVGRRVWNHDPSVWGNADASEVANRLDWLHLPDTMANKVSDWAAFADVVRDGSFTDVLLLGMGGSSLAPEMYQSVFGNDEGSPHLQVLDSTHPDAVVAMAESLNLDTTLFVVSSKSGGTLETLSFFRYFYALLSDLTSNPGSHFVAITDPDSGLEALATERSFRAIFNAPAGVGGRFSALCDFGLLPASLIGADVTAILGSARRMAEACGPEVAVADNPGMTLGAWMGESAIAGKDKLTVLCSESLAAFPGWFEQLVAESTGKLGLGIVPVAGEAVGDPSLYGADRTFITYHLAGDAPIAGVADLVVAGFEVKSFELESPTDLGAEMYRAEFATAMAGAVMGINPFDQPDVEAAKISARALMTGATEEHTSFEFGSLSDVAALAKKGDTIALQAYVPGTPEILARLARLQVSLRARTGAAVTAGIGPRFLHSTGQLHKGGSTGLVAVQFVSGGLSDVPVPETDVTFGDIITAQADGDGQVLLERGMRLVRLPISALPA